MNIKSKANKVGTIALAALSVRVIDTVMKSGIVEATHSKQFVNLLGLNSRYQVAITPNGRLQKSEGLKQLFKLRNKTFVDIYGYVDGQTKSPLADVKLAADKVFVVLNKYGRKISKARIADLTIRYIRIIDLLKMAEMEEALTKISLTDKLAEFESIQISYEELYMELGNEFSERDTPTSLRKEMQNAVKTYADELKWLANNQDTDDWKTLYANVEQRFNEMTVSQSHKKDEPMLTMNVSEPQISDTAV